MYTERMAFKVQILSLMTYDACRKRVARMTNICNVYITSGTVNLLPKMAPQM